MFNPIPLLCVFFTLASSIFGFAAGPAANTSLLSNGNFELNSKGADWPDDWPHIQGTSWEKEGGLHFLRLKSFLPGKEIEVYRQVILPSPPPPALEIRLRLRYAGVKIGNTPWHDARFMAHFKDKTGKTLQPEPEVPSYSGSSDGWIDRAYVVKVPANAHLFELMPSLYHAAQGTMDVAKCEVFPTTEEQLPKLAASTTRVPANPASLPPELRVAGSQLRTKEGKAVWLQGLCLDALQWSTVGDHILKSIPVAVDRWKANVIRLPIKEDFWAGRGSPGQDGGEAYRRKVDAAIDAAASRGAYLVVALDKSDKYALMPDTDDIDLWKDVATRYKNNPAVLFELFNDPHGVSWKVWRDGGDLTDPNSKDAEVNAADNAPQAVTGMQALLDAIRATGAENIVVADGLDYGYDLSGVIKDYALQERPGGNGIMYSSHIYPWKKNWRENTLDAAAKYPIFIGEVATPPDWNGFEFIPNGIFPLTGLNHWPCEGGPPQNAPSIDDLGPKWAPDVLGMIQKYKLNWAGSSFYPRPGLALILDWNYTPTPYWGVFVKEALAGKRFEMQKMR
jgi:hypothetical protein